VQSLGAYSEYKKHVATLLLIKHFLNLLGESRAVLNGFYLRVNLLNIITIIPKEWLFTA